MTREYFIDNKRSSPQLCCGNYANDVLTLNIEGEGNETFAALVFIVIWTVRVDEGTFFNGVEHLTQ